MRSRSTVAAGALAVLATFGVAAPAVAAGSTSGRYYDAYFSTKTTCNNRGYAMVNYEHIQRMTGWNCWKYFWESKWSMDVYWNGGGGGSWSPPQN